MINSVEPVLLITANKTMKSKKFTEFISWKDVFGVDIGQKIIRAPGSAERSHSIIKQDIFYENMTFSVDVPFIDFTNNSNIRSALWKYDQSIRELHKKYAKICSSPILNRFWTIVGIAILLCFIIPILVNLVKCIWTQKYPSFRRISQNLPA